jgi:hypothetical protein
MERTSLSIKQAKIIMSFIPTVTISVFFLFSLIFFTVPSLAQDENSTYTEPMSHTEDKDVGYGAETSFLTWHGYLNFEFIKPEKKNSTFDNHEFYLSTRADISTRVSVTAEFEYEHTPEKLILPMQAYADLKMKKALTFRAGMFFTPLGISRSYNLRGNRNRMIRQVALTHDIMFENWAEVGIDVFGEFKSGIFYDVAIGNGMPNTMGTGDSFFDATNSLTSHTEDNNENKALHSRFGYHSTKLAGELNVGVSYGTEKYDPDNKKEMTHIGADLRYLHKSGIRVQTEYMARSGDDNPVDFAKGISAEALGWYLQLSKRFVFKNNAWIHHIEPVVQVDFIDLNTNANTNGDKLTTAVGLIYSPEDYYLVKMEYDIVKEKYGVAVDDNKLWLAIVVEF